MVLGLNGCRWVLWDGGVIGFRVCVFFCRPKRLVARAAINSTGFWTPEAAVPNYDIWSIRKDLEVPSWGFLGESPRAQGGQGPPPMLAERFQSVITQLFQQV